MLLGAALLSVAALLAAGSGPPNTCAAGDSSCAGAACVDPETGVALTAAQVQADKAAAMRAQGAAAHYYQSGKLDSGVACDMVLLAFL